MKEKPCISILDRENPKKFISENFQQAILLLKDIVNYGSNLIPRCYDRGHRTLTDSIILGVFLKQAVAMIDAAEILISKGSIYACHIQQRTLFEVSLYIEWVFKKDTDIRIRHYYVSNLRKERLWCSRFLPGETNEKSFSSIIGDDIMKGVQEKNKPEDLEKRIKEIDEFLKQQKYKEINQEFEKKKGKREWEPFWYNPIGIRSIRDIAKNLNRLEEYEILYYRERPLI